MFPRGVSLRKVIDWKSSVNRKKGFAQLTLPINPRNLLSAKKEELVYFCGISFEGHGSSIKWP
jgi:hypothetical protein